MAPRRILPGTTYLITRRTVQRTFLLRPSRQLNQAFLYCLAYAAERYGIGVHAFCVMSNHMHLVVTDPRGTLPQFMQWLNLFPARSGCDPPFQARGAPLARLPSTQHIPGQPLTSFGAFRGFPAARHHTRSISRSLRRKGARSGGKSGRHGNGFPWRRKIATPLGNPTQSAA